MYGSWWVTQIPGFRMTRPFSYQAHGDVQYLLGPINTVLQLVSLGLLKSWYSPWCSILDMHFLSSREVFPHLIFFSHVVSPTYGKISNVEICVVFTWKFMISTRKHSFLGERPSSLLTLNNMIINNYFSVIVVCYKGFAHNLTAFTPLHFEVYIVV